MIGALYFVKVLGQCLRLCSVSLGIGAEQSQLKQPRKSVIWSSTDSELQVLPITVIDSETVDVEIIGVERVESYIT